MIINQQKLYKISLFISANWIFTHCVELYLSVQLLPISKYKYPSISNQIVNLSIPISKVITQSQTQILINWKMHQRYFPNNKISKIGIHLSFQQLFTALMSSMPNKQTFLSQNCIILFWQPSLVYCFNLTPLKIFPLF
jgi:hypothetical protein